MSESEIIQTQLLKYNIKTLAEQEHALKEIAQEIALLALSRTDFFRIAEFQGGTCLRILYQLKRYSEDLDFVLKEPNKNFIWKPYIIRMKEEFLTYGFNLEIQDKAKIHSAIKMTFLKANSMGGLLILKDIKNQKTQLKIKLEIDTQPPSGSLCELKYLDFPTPFSITAQNLPSLFAGKCHALLCRNYLKGRDWFDFIWYVSGQPEINFNLFKNALFQAGPWKNQHINCDAQWLAEELKTKINSINWQEAQKDVARFLKPQELEGLKIWSKEFFISRVDKLQRYLL